MSTAPPNNLAQSNMTYALMGLVGGVLVLCGGFFVMALVTLGVLGKSSLVAQPNSRPQPGATAASTEPAATDTSSKKVALQFLGYLRASRYGDAYNHCNSTMQSAETLDEFTRRIQGYRGIAGSQEFGIGRSSSGQTPTNESWNGSFKRGPAGEVKFSIDLVLENDGWKVRQFSLQ